MPSKAIFSTRYRRGRMPIWRTSNANLVIGIAVHHVWSFWLHQQQQPIASSFYHYRRSFRLNCRLPEWQSAAVLGPAVPLREASGWPEP